MPEFRLHDDPGETDVPGSISGTAVMGTRAIMRPSSWLPCLALMLVAASNDRTICHDDTGDSGGVFHRSWRHDGEGCLTLLRDGGYRVRWSLRPSGNLVAGRGWRRGSSNRVVSYRIRRFEPGANGYLALYGWSRNPLVEYYVVDDWGGFTPPGPSAEPMGVVRSDGGTYRMYRTLRVEQPSIAGKSTFVQYWSVRTERRAPTGYGVITFGNHVAAWRRAGMTLGSLDYQVLAIEGFGSTGTAEVTLRNVRERIP